MTRYSQIIKVCTICNASYKVKKYRAKASKYCSRKCWSNRSPQTQKQCKYCQQQFMSYPSAQQRYCSISCSRKDMTGEKATAYKDGKSLQRQRARDGHRLRIWRKQVFDRDRYTCQKCGYKGRHLQAHHVQSYAQYEKLRFDIDNGLTVCLPCHEAIHGRKLRSPSKYPSRCIDCGNSITKQSYRCRACSTRHSWIARREKST